MDYQNILVEDLKPVCKITFNRPNALNALNTATLKEINDIIEQLEKNDEILIVVFTGMGKAFIAGADVSEMANMNELEASEYGKIGSSVFRRIELLNKVTIASVNGYCLGGGCELALACDLRIASTKAKFGQPEVTLGITPGFSGTQRLPRLIGASKAKELLFTGKMIDASQALDLGLVNQVVDVEELESTIDSLSQLISKNSKSAIRYVKKAVNEGIEAPIDDAIELETIYFSKCFSTEDQKEGMKAFLEKRKANFN